MNRESENDTVLEVRDLKTRFELAEGTVRAVDGVSLSIPRGGTLGVVGESGCGKSITSMSVMRLVPHPGRIVSGQITFHRPLSKDNPTVTEAVDLVSLVRPSGRSCTGTGTRHIPIADSADRCRTSPRCLPCILYHPILGNLCNCEQLIPQPHNASLHQPQGYKQQNCCGIMGLNKHQCYRAIYDKRKERF